MNIDNATPEQHVKDYLDRQALAWALWDDAQGNIRWDAMSSAYLPGERVEDLQACHAIPRLPGFQSYLEREFNILKHHGETRIHHKTELMLHATQVLSPEWMQQHFPWKDAVTDPLDWNEKTGFFDSHDAIRTNRNLYYLYTASEEPSVFAQKWIKLARAKDIIWVLQTDMLWAKKFPEHAQACRQMLLQAIDNPKSAVHAGLRKSIGLPIRLSDDPEIRNALCTWIDKNQLGIPPTNKNPGVNILAQANLCIEHSFLRNVAKDFQVRSDNNLGWLSQYPWLSQDKHWRAKIWSWLKTHTTRNAENQEGYTVLHTWVIRQKDISMHDWTSREIQSFTNYVNTPDVARNITKHIITAEITNVDHLSPMLRYALKQPMVIARLIEAVLDRRNLEPNILKCVQYYNAQLPPPTMDTPVHPLDPKTLLVWGLLRVVDPTLSANGMHSIWETLQNEQEIAQDIGIDVSRLETIERLVQSLGERMTMPTENQIQDVLDML